MSGYPRGLAVSAVMKPCRALTVPPGICPAEDLRLRRPAVSLWSPMLQKDLLLLEARAWGRGCVGCSAPRLPRQDASIHVLCDTFQTT